MFKELAGRWTAPTPKFWQRVRRLGLVLGTAGAAMLAAPATLPSWIPIAGGYVTLAGSLIAGLSQLTCEDQPSTPQPEA